MQRLSRRSVFLHSTQRVSRVIFGSVSWSSNSSSCGALKASRVLLRKDIRPLSSMEMVEIMASHAEANTGEGTTPLELSLFDDPTGGLAAGPAEELSTTDMEAQIHSCISCYSPDIFYLLYTPFVDVVALLEQEGLVPETTIGFRPETEIVKWFTDGSGTFKDPYFTEKAMGHKRWKLLCAALHKFYEPIEGVMPLTRIVRGHCHHNSQPQQHQHGRGGGGGGGESGDSHTPVALHEELYVPFLRQLAMNLADPERRREMVEMLPGLVLGLANGRAPASLGLPSHQAERVMLVSELLLGVSQETGNTDLAFLGIQLLRANNMATPFAFQKQLTSVFAASARISTDWLTRSTGQLVDAYPKWVEYFKKVRADNVRALARLQAEKDENESGESPNKSVKKKAERIHRAYVKEGDSAEVELPLSSSSSSQEQHEYFTSKRREDVERLSELERNVEEAVWARSPLLIKKPRGRRRLGAAAMPPTSLLPHSKEEAATLATEADSGHDSSIWAEKQGKEVPAAQGSEKDSENTDQHHKKANKMKKKQALREAKRSDEGAEDDEYTEFSF